MLPGAYEQPVMRIEPLPTNAVLFPYNHAASIAQMPNGDLLVAWGAGTRELAADAVILVSRRRAGEIDWSRAEILVDRPGQPDANPVLFVDPAGITHLYHVEVFGDHFCLGNVFEQTSADSGVAWSPPRQPWPDICVMVRHPPTIALSGRWVFPTYIEGVYASQFRLSDDGGASWRCTPPLLTLPDNNLQPAVVTLADGSLLALARRSGTDPFTWELRSRNEGETWSLHQRDDLPTPDSGLALLRLRSGLLVAAFNPHPQGRTPLAVAWSADEGITWSSPRTIEDGPPQLSYPSMIEDSNGMIHIAYTHQLAYIAHAEFNLSWLLNGPVTLP